MITCNGCNYVNPAGELYCQRCGAPLVEQNIQSAKANKGTPSELPAWLESLRSQERPMSSNNGPSDNGSSPFNAANLIDEGTLPIWMRPERGGGNSPNPRLHTASFSAPNTDESSLVRGISAGSLIDENALPSWMRPGQSEAKGVPSTPPRDVSASSLVELDSLPEWMRNGQPQGQAQSPKPQQPQMPPMSTPSPLSAAGQPSMSAGPAHGFSARDLVDQQALPAWMTQQSGRESNSGTLSPQVAPPTAQQSMSASSLVDPNALPSWMREGSQGPSTSQPHNAAASSSWQMPQPNMQQVQPGQQAGPGWQPQVNQQTHQQANQPINQQMPNGFLAAPSLIDPNALPAWLRPTNAPAAPGAYGPPRVENVRVPSRPRGEQGPQEGSEVAANVFASMLGVASAAPNFPAQQGLQGGPGGPMPQAPMMPQTPGMSNAQPPMPMAGMAPAGSGPYAMNNALQPPTYGVQSMNNAPQNIPPRGYPGNTPAGMNAMNAPGMPQSGMPQSAMGAQQMPMGTPMMGEQSANAKAAKHGFLETIRSWFFRS